MLDNILIQSSNAKFGFVTRRKALTEFEDWSIMYIIAPMEWWAPKVVDNFSKSS
jgi:hypothetical protein